MIYPGVGEEERGCTCPALSSAMRVWAMWCEGRMHCLAFTWKMVSGPHTALNSTVHHTPPPPFELFLKVFVISPFATPWLWCFPDVCCPMSQKPFLLDSYCFFKDSGIGIWGKGQDFFCALDHMPLLQVEAEKLCPCGLMLSFSESSLTVLHLSWVFEALGWFCRKQDGGFWFPGFSLLMAFSGSLIKTEVIHIMEALWHAGFSLVCSWWQKCYEAQGECGWFFLIWSTAATIPPLRPNLSTDPLVFQCFKSLVSPANWESSRCPSLLDRSGEAHVMEGETVWSQVFISEFQEAVSLRNEVVSPEPHTWRDQVCLLHIAVSASHLLTQYKMIYVLYPLFYFICHRMISGLFHLVCILVKGM